MFDLLQTRSDCGLMSTVITLVHVEKDPDRLSKYYLMINRDDRVDKVFEIPTDIVEDNIVSFNYFVQITYTSIDVLNFIVFQ